MTSGRNLRARIFGAVADDYERGRPGYPGEAIAWLLPAAGQRVVDIGAGTGKLTAALVAAGHQVVAVEPDARMLELLCRAVPEADPQAGSAEKLPLADMSMDAAVAGQAFHWFDAARALPEIRRVLVPGGTLGLVWNLRDTRQAWLAELSRILQSDAHSVLDHARLAGLFADHDLFTPLQRVEFSHAQIVDLPALLAAVRSRSAVALLEPSERDAVLAEITSLWKSHPALRGRTEVSLPYRTTVWRTRRAPTR